MLGWFTAASTAVKVGIVLAILAAIAGFGWLVYHTLYHWGYDEAVAEFTPKIAKANADRDAAVADLKLAQDVNVQYAEEMKRLDQIVFEQNTAIKAYQEAALQSEIKLRKALVEVAQKEKRYSAEIARLLAIASGPVITEGACEEADAILRALMRDRLRDPA
jgi:hypothetical protein